MVYTGPLSNQERGGGQRALGKEGAVLCLMLEGQNLGAGIDDDLLNANCIAHAQGVNANLLPGALTIFMAAYQKV